MCSIVINYLWSIIHEGGIEYMKEGFDTITTKDKKVTPSETMPISKKFDRGYGAYIHSSSREYSWKCVRGKGKSMNEEVPGNAAAKIGIS